MKGPDPKRLSELGSDMPARLRDALGAARSDLPSAERVARLASRLPVGGTPAAGTGAGSAASVPSTLSGALVGAALGVVVSAVALFAPGTAPLEPSSQRPAPPAATASVGSLAAPLPPRAAAEKSERPASPLPTLVAPSTARRSLPPSASLAEPPPETPPAPAVETESEVHLLQRAHEALGADAAQALALTQEHAARFASGAFVQEREVVAIQALVRLGRSDEARTRAASFVARFPRSAHRRRVEALVAP